MIYPFYFIHFFLFFIIDKVINAFCLLLIYPCGLSLVRNYKRACLIFYPYFLVRHKNIEKVVSKFFMNLILVFPYEPSSFLFFGSHLFFILVLAYILHKDGKGLISLPMVHASIIMVLFCFN